MSIKKTNSNVNQGAHVTDKGKIVTFITIVLAVACSVVIWFFAIDYDSPDYSKTFIDVAINVTGERELRESLGYTLLEKPDLTVDVTIVGKRTDVNRVRASDITAVIDLSSVAAAGNNRFSVQITAPNGTSVASQSINDVVLYVDNFITRQYTVKVRQANYVLAQDVYIDSIVCSPATITVSGPENELDKISGACIDLELGELVNSVKSSATAKLLDINNAEFNNPYVFINSSNVTAFVSVYVEREVPVKVALVGGVYSSLIADIRCDTETVTLRGSVEQMANVREYLIQIDETDTELDAPIKVLIDPPAGVTNVSETEYATVIVSIPDIGKSDIVVSSDKIAILNIPNGVEVSAVEDVVVHLRGLQDVLDTLTHEDISVTVDMSNLGEVSSGTITVPVTVTIKNENIVGVFVYHNSSYTVDVLIK